MYCFIKPLRIKGLPERFENMLVYDEEKTIPISTSHIEKAKLNLVFRFGIKSWSTLTLIMHLCSFVMTQLQNMSQSVAFLLVYRVKLHNTWYHFVVSERKRKDLYRRLLLKHCAPALMLYSNIKIQIHSSFRGATLLKPPWPVVFVPKDDDGGKHILHLNNRTLPWREIYETNRIKPRSR